MEFDINLKDEQIRLECLKIASERTEDTSVFFRFQPDYLIDLAEQYFKYVKEGKKETQEVRYAPRKA